MNVPDGDLVRHGPTPGSPRRGRGILNKFVADPVFQRWAARFPLTRRLVRRDGEALFDVVAGFCHSQILSALITLDIPEKLQAGPHSVRALAAHCDVPEPRMEILLRAGAALGLLKTRRDGRYGLARKGAALTGVPGLAAMIRHHEVLYRDLADPVAFFRDGTATELAQFWPYVFGAAQAEAPETAQRYSKLMADSQLLVADDTLDAVSLRGVSRLMDVGGGTGVFLGQAASRYPQLAMTVFDLPAVVAGVPVDDSRFSGRLETVGGSFRDDPLPDGADAISLIRVLYDHSDDTVRDLLASVFRALPSGGRLIISEPMTGSRAGDAYFSLYTLAMQTGRTRASAEIAALCAAAGFVDARAPRARRPFITSVLTARKPR